MTSFFKHFAILKGQQAVEAVKAEIILHNIDTASAAELLSKDEELTGAGLVIAKLRKELGDEHHELEQIEARYSQLMSAAENLRAKIEDPATAEADRSSKQASLDNLLGKMSTVVAELDRDRQTVADTERLLHEAEQAYQEKAEDIRRAKHDLDQGKHDLQHAQIDRERAERLAENASVVAGLKKPASSSLNVALDAMRKSADQARAEADANRMKAGALKGASDAADDPNVAAAIAETSGPQNPQSLADRLAALKR